MENIFNIPLNKPGLVVHGEQQLDYLIKMCRELGISINNSILEEYLLKVGYVSKNNDVNKEKLCGNTRTPSNYLSMHNATLKLRNHLKFSNKLNGNKHYLCLMLPEHNQEGLYIFTDQKWVYYVTAYSRKISEPLITLDLFLYKFIVEGKTLHNILKKFITN